MSFFLLRTDQNHPAKFLAFGLGLTDPLRLIFTSDGVGVGVGVGVVIRSVSSENQTTES